MKLEKKHPEIRYYIIINIIIVIILLDLLLEWSLGTMRYLDIKQVMGMGVYDWKTG